jgi:hypothetical protein
MKNKFLLKVGILIAILFSQNIIVRAQYVPFPDPNFAEYLYLHHSGCIY